MEIEMEKRIPLEQASVNICSASAVPPRIYQIPPEQGREKLNKAQDAPVYKDLYSNTAKI